MMVAWHIEQITTLNTEQILCFLCYMVAKTQPTYPVSDGPINHSVLRAAYDIGYRVGPAGVVISPHGTQLHTNPGRYATVTVKVKMEGRGNSHIVYVHRLAAFQQFGEAMFEPGIEVRHADDNGKNNRPDNIILGTHFQNYHDTPLEERKARAQRSYLSRVKHLTAAQRAEFASNASRVRYAGMTAEERSEASKNASAAFQRRMLDASPEERKEQMANAISANIKYADTDKATVVDAYNGGLGVLRISKKLSIPKSSVRSILRVSGVKLRGVLPDAEHRRQSAKRL